mmetsp:Transcript_7526/g.16669  ORF Transcript_7526/g.16669 Transcript_7526/m.16669 type:complete len:237 (+) Transcript_7526:14-724(+)
MIKRPSTAAFCVVVTVVFGSLFGFISADVAGVKGVIWYAPFTSGGGYCSESISYAVALIKRGVPLRTVQHGDSYNDEFWRNLNSETKRQLEASASTPVDPATAVVVCHSEPGAWATPTPRWPTSTCPPRNAQYKVGRTMFETDRIPEGWAERINQMDEVWVPTQFANETFVAGGVDRRKVRIIPGFRFLGPRMRRSGRDCGHQTVRPDDHGREIPPITTCPPRWLQVLEHLQMGGA